MAKKRKIDKTPATSEGARYERTAFRNAVRRRIKLHDENDPAWHALYEVLDWVLERQKRYDKRPGGL